MDYSAQRPNVIAVEDKEGRITAFIHELPGLVVQGNSKSEVSVKLDKLILAFISKLDNIRNNLEIETRPIA